MRESEANEDDTQFPPAMVLVRRRRSFKTIRRWTKATIRFWTNWWTGISIWTLAFVVARFFGPLASLGVAFWLCCEAVNYVVFCVVFAPRLIRFSAADARDLSRGAVSEASFAAAVDHVCFLIEKDPGRFWQRVTGIADIDSVPVATALSFVKSLLFVFDDVACCNYNFLCVWNPVVPHMCRRLPHAEMSLR